MDSQPFGLDILLTKLSELGIDTLRLNFAGTNGECYLFNQHFEKDGQKTMLDAKQISVHCPVSYRSNTKVMPDDYFQGDSEQLLENETSLNKLVRIVYGECLKLFDVEDYVDGDGGEGSFTISRHGIHLELVENSYDSDTLLDIHALNSQLPNGSWSLDDARVKSLFDEFKSAMQKYGASEARLLLRFNWQNFDPNTAYPYHFSSNLDQDSNQEPLSSAVNEILSKTEFNWLKQEVGAPVENRFISSGAIGLRIDKSRKLEIMEISLEQTINTVTKTVKTLDLPMSPSPDQDSGANFAPRFH